MNKGPRNYDSPFYDENDELDYDDLDEDGEIQSSQISDFTYQNGEIYSLRSILNKPTDLLVSSDISLLDTLDDEMVNDRLTD